MDNQSNTTDRNFDGHLEKDVIYMTPKEKLDYIWKMIELKNYVRNNVKRKE